MVHRIKVLVSNDTLTIYKNNHKKVYSLSEDTICDGYILKQEIIHDILEHYYRRYGGRKYPVTFVIHSTTIFRWVCTLPEATDKELAKMLMNHQSELLPIQSEDYHMVYRVLRQGNEEGERRVGVVGIPKSLQEDYMTLGKKLKINKVVVLPTQDYIIGSIQEGISESSLVIYGMDGQLYAMIIDQQFCCMTQHLLRDVSYHETEEMCFLNHLLHLLQFQRKEEGEYLRLYKVNDEATSTTLQKVGVEDAKTYFTEKLHMEVDELEEGKIDIASLENIGFIPFKKTINQRMKMKWQHTCLYYTILLIIGIGGMSIGSLTLQKVYYTNRLTKLKEQLQQPAYLEVQALEEKQVQLAKRREGIEQLVDDVAIRCRTILQQIEKLEHVSVTLEQFIEGYSISGEGREVVIKGDTPTPYGVINSIKKLEQAFKTYDVKCQFESNNRLGPTKFSILMSEGSSRQDGEMD